LSLNLSAPSGPPGGAGQDGSQGPPGDPGATGPPGPSVGVIPYSYPGDLSVRVGTARLYMPTGGTNLAVTASVGTRPNVQPVIVDVNKNGSSVFTTQANRPSVGVTPFTSGVKTPNVTTFAAGDYFTVDVDQIGTQPVEAVTFVDYQVAASSFNTSSYNVTRPANAVAGDIHLCFIRAKDLGTWSAPAGAGWTLSNSVTGFNNTAKLYTFWRVVDGSTGPWTFTGTLTATSIFAFSAIYRGQKVSAPVDAATSAATAFSATVTPAALTTTAANALVVEYATSDVSKTVTGGVPPTGYTNRLNFDATANSWKLADMAQASAGAANSGAFTYSDGSTYTLVSRVALAPEPVPSTWSPGADLTVLLRYIEA